MRDKQYKDSVKRGSQGEAFIKAARAAECDESEAAFEGKLRRIAAFTRAKKVGLVKGKKSVKKSPATKAYKKGI